VKDEVLRETVNYNYSTFLQTKGQLEFDAIELGKSKPASEFPSRAGSTQLNGMELEDILKFWGQRKAANGHYSCFLLLTKLDKTEDGLKSVSAADSVRVH